MNKFELRKYAKAAEPDFFEKYDGLTLLKNHFTLNFDLVPNMEVNYQNCRFLCEEGTQYENNILNDKSKVISIIARLGGGKTKQIFKIINQKKYQKILFLSPRISFAQAIQNDFKDEGLEIINYNESDKKIMNSAAALVITLESLHKLDKNNIYDCVILDESESILSQFKSTTHKNNINDTNDQLMTYIERAERVFFADALMSNKTLNYIKHINGDKSIHINIIKKITNKTAYQIKTDSQKKTKNEKIFNSPMLSIIKESIYKDENLFIASSSKTRLLKYRSLLQREAHKNKTISDYISDFNSLFYFDMMDDDTKNSTLKNINIEWSQKKIIATTPLITVGNSYNENEARKSPDYEPHFNKVLLIAGPGSCCVRDSIQTTKRVRYTKIYNIILSHTFEKEIKNKIEIDFIKKS